MYVDLVFASIDWGSFNKMSGSVCGRGAGRTPASVTSRESSLPTQLDHHGLLTNTVGGFVKNCSPLEMAHTDIYLPVEF